MPAWILGTSNSAHFFLMLLAILAVPLARPSAVLLALASNRHLGTALPEKARAGGGRLALRATLVLLAAPLALAVVLCVSFYARNRDTGGFVSSGEERTGCTCRRATTPPGPRRS